MPRAHHMPDFAVLSHPVPAKTNPLGVKGCGEAGCAGSLTSIMNAVVDALSVYGIKHIDMPATPAAGLAGDPGRQDAQNKSQAPASARRREADGDVDAQPDMTQVDRLAFARGGPTMSAWSRA